MPDRILIGKGEQPVHLLAKYGNRHGLVAGATGTGKTVSLMVLAEGFSRLGVPVFMADVKGDVAGLAVPGAPSDKIQQRRRADSASPATRPKRTRWCSGICTASPGHPVRTTVSEIGPTLLGRMLELNDTQSGVLEIAFKLADDRGLLLLDLDDLRAAADVRRRDTARTSRRSYGLVSTQSIAAIQRALLTLEREGGDAFFGEPALELADLMRTDLDGRGIINILAADQLILKPRLYSSFLLWLLSELFENLPEVGDLDKPKLVFIFDEAHLLFDDAPPALRQRVEQVVRIIRSKGVGVYFCSQFPDDVPERDPRPARQPHSARAARVHAARPEGGAHRGRDVRRRIRSSTSRRSSRSSASAKRWSRRCRRTACRCRWSGRSSLRRAAAWARSPPDERAAVRAAQPGRRQIRHTRSTASRRYEMLSATRADATAPPPIRAARPDACRNGQERVVP